MKKVDSKIYDRSYFLNAVEGYQNFDDFLSNINPKFKKGLKMAKLKKGERILDVGCGRGEMVFFANLLYGCEGVGIDYAKDAIEICDESKKRLNLQNNEFVRFLQVDSDRLPFEDKSFDVIFFMDVWEHIYPEQIDQLLKEFRRLLRDNGRLIVHTSPNKKFFGIGFPRYTYYFNYVINKLLYRPLLKKNMTRSNVNPRSEYEKMMHINEQTVEGMELSLAKAGLKGDVFVDDYFSMFSSPVLFAYYLFAQPFYLPFLKEIFGEHIWGKILKNKN
ncbi:MAG: hypothetical protein C0412_19870 [Flavobacterium sp.]|nr:hypothetical protein [Flavobacterium sp.]